MPGADYEITFAGRTYPNSSNENAGGKGYIYNETTGTKLGEALFNNTGYWHYYTINFTAPSNASDVVNIKLATQSYTIVGSDVAYDNVKIKRVGDDW